MSENLRGNLKKGEIRGSNFAWNILYAGAMQAALAVFSFSRLSLSLSFREVLYLPSFVSREAVRAPAVLSPREFRPFPLRLSSRPHCRPRLMAYFKRRNCSQLISGIQSANTAPAIV